MLDKLRKTITGLAHFFCGLLAGFLSGVLPFSSLLLFSFFFLYEWLEYTIRKDAIVRDLRQFGIGLSLGVLLSWFYLIW